MTTPLMTELQEFTQLEALRNEIQQVSEVALKQQILSAETKDAALAIGADVKRMRKALDERRKQITAPMQDAVKRIIAFAAQLDAPLEKAESHIRQQAVAYAQVIAEEQRKAAAVLEAERIRIRKEEEIKMRNAAAMATDFQEQHTAQEQVRTEVKQQVREVNLQAQAVKAQGVKGTTEVWVFEVQNPEIVPREYLAVNESLIRQAVQYRKLREIPGVRIYQETRVRLG